MDKRKLADIIKTTGSTKFSLDFPYDIQNQKTVDVDFTVLFYITIMTFCKRTETDGKRRKKRGKEARAEDKNKKITCYLYLITQKMEEESTRPKKTSWNALRPRLQSSNPNWTR